MSTNRSAQKVMLVAIFAILVVVVVVSLDASPDHAPIETIPNFAPEPESPTEPDAVQDAESGSESEAGQITIDLSDIIPLPEVDIPDPVATIPDIQE